ncbi:MAG: valine--tRNA ligase [Rhodospirillaceae bacterium]|nr:valine--tRNA ligase [Rhodospirillaceae bacterium]
MLDKTYCPRDIESKNYHLWEAANIFSIRLNDDAHRSYTIMMPPPNVTGNLHMGHALTFTLQDILIRYQRMRGRDVLWQPGTDHAGIATQIIVERQLATENLNSKDLGREKFIKRIWKWKSEYGGTIANQLRQLGVSPDWSRERFTMDEGLSKAVNKVFVELYKQGFIYRDKHLVNWDPKLHTAISDLEVESREIHGYMWYLKYPIDDYNDRFITVATTRPETMLGDSGIAVHPKDDRYKDIVGKFVRLPITSRLIPIIADEYSDPEKGTGAVKITPAHDFNDFEVGRRHNLSIINIFNHNAQINENAPEIYQGLDRYDARKKIIAEFERLELLERVESHVLQVPYGDRSGVVIEPLLTDQWFVDVIKLAKPAIEAVKSGRTRFIPKHWENTYYEWMRNIQPWCISRQIWWGHQIPAWYGPDGHCFVELNESEAMDVAIDYYGKSVTLIRDVDVLDTWFSSSLWPFSTLDWPNNNDILARYYPTDVLVTGFDIIFFWVARMMMMGLHFMGDVPFREVYIHALVRDEKGQKMSKSKGNVIDPLTMIDKYGCDALRFTMAAMATQGRDIKLIKNRVEGYRNFATKIWNVARFCQMNDCKLVLDFDMKQSINRWIVGKLTKTTNYISVAIEDYRFNDAANAAYQFVWNNFCDWYIELSKPVLHGEDIFSKIETRAVIAWVFNKILHILHPFMPFITEHLWKKLFNESDNFLMTDSWPILDFKDNDIDIEFDWLIKLISNIRAVRTEMNVPQNVRVPLLIKSTNKIIRKRLIKYRENIFTMARISSIAIVECAEIHGVIQIVVDEEIIFLYLSNIIDLNQEKDRLIRNIDKFSLDIKIIEKKLDDQKFITGAPIKVIKEKRDRLNKLIEIQSNLKNALKCLHV